MLFDEILIERFDNTSTWQIKIVFSEENLHVINFNTDSRISLCARAHYLEYVKETHQGHRITFSDF